MKPSWVHRALFLGLFGATAWVGFFGFFRPEEIHRALAFPVPPLHARFIGAIYLGTAVFCALSLISRSLVEIRTTLHIATWWTGWLLMVTILQWDRFDLANPRVWFWVVAYVVFPTVGAWLLLGPSRDRAEAPASAVIAEPWIRLALRVQGFAFVVLALLFFLAPNAVVAIWPWKVSAFLTQIYSGPVLGYGLGSLVLARHGNWRETFFPSLGLLLASCLAIVGSLRHLALFAPGSPSKMVWFATLAALALFSGFLTWRAAVAARS